MTKPITVTRDTVRRLAVCKQGLHQRPPTQDRGALLRIIKNIGLLQLDSINVTARSHYLVMLARAGLYDTAALDALLDEGALFESWAHAICQIPMADYPYFHAWIQRRKLKTNRWPKDRLGDDFHATVERARETVRQRGPMTSRDFASEKREPGGWWNWKPTKVALEYLFDRGELMVIRRVNFQRYYELSERVLAGRGLVLDKSFAEYQRWAVERGLRHLGIASSNHAADYHRLSKRATAGILKDMLAAGEILSVDVAGWQDAAYIHRGDLELLDEIQAGQHEPGMTVFLSPFDNLFWDRARDMDLWDFHYRIEVYRPKAKRVYGYYVLPILRGSRLVGRVDAKVDRKNRRLIFNALYLEKGCKYSAALGRGLIAAIEEFMAFHHCESFELAACEHKVLAGQLRRYFA